MIKLLKFNLIKLFISSSLVKVPLCEEQKAEYTKASGLPQSQQPSKTVSNDIV